MSAVAIVTDSASDLPPDLAGSLGIRVVPLVVRFGTHEFQAGVDLSAEDFWTRMLAPDAPFPTTAAPAPGAFAEAYAGAFAAGAASIVCVTIGSRLSGTFASAELAAKEHPGREIHVVDSMSASMGVGHLATLGVELAAAGLPAAEVAATLRARAADLDIFVALDTLEYLRRGGRLSPARAAIGTLLSVKPIVTVVDGLVETADRVRTLQEADAIFIQEIRSAGLYDHIWQAFAVLLPIKTVGVMGDERTYENVCALRAVHSVDGMTADWVQLPYDMLGRAGNRIINEVKGINRVVYDISSKPPSTIEWE